MANNLSIDSKLIDLSVAIIKNDLPTAKVLVVYFNQQPSSVFSEGFNLYDFYDYRNTETYVYVISNLTTYPNIDRIKWDVLIIDKMIERYMNLIITSEDVHNFITEKLNDESLESYQLASLIRLANIIHNYDDLYKIKRKIENMGGDV